MVLYSLCPVPSFQNMVIRHLLNPEAAPLANNGCNQGNNASGDFPYQIYQPHRLSFQFTGLNSMLGSQMGISNHEQPHEAIPDFETMHIGSRLTGDQSETQGLVEANSFPREFECWDIRF